MTIRRTATAALLPATINGVAVEKLAKTVNAIKATPSITKFNFRIRNEWRGAAKNSSTIDRFYGALTCKDFLRSTRTFGRGSKGFESI